MHKRVLVCLPLSDAHRAALEASSGYTVHTYPRKEAEQA